MYFRPTNPLPKSAWIQVIYPVTVTVESEQDFLDNCEAVTSASFKGAAHCSVDTSQRLIYIFDVFRE
jgi:hypothetical protein